MNFSKIRFIFPKNMNEQECTYEIKMLHCPVYLRHDVVRLALGSDPKMPFGSLNTTWFMTIRRISRSWCGCRSDHTLSESWKTLECHFKIIQIVLRENFTGDSLWVRPHGTMQSINRKSSRWRTTSNIEVFQFGFCCFISDSSIVNYQMIGNAQLVMRITAKKCIVHLVVLYPKFLQRYKILSKNFF